MSRVVKPKVASSSTVEAIRMASASVLGSSTGHGYSIGDAVGVGRMMEANSEAVEKKVTPLILSVRNPLKTSEQLELLSMEWDLERAPGGEILPEQLVVAGGFARDVRSHVCMLTYEKGIVDPFNIEERVKQIAKKLADLEAATEASGMRLEKEGLAVLQRFSGRLNRILFVDMLDRQFQGSWDTIRVKPEDVDVEAVVRTGFRKDFTTLPPGIRIAKRRDLEFMLPDADDAALTEHFKHRVLSPSAVRTLSMQVPEIGRAILSEMNRYAYSIEEEEVAKAMTAALVRFIGRSEVRIGDLDLIVKQAIDFIGVAKNAVRILSDTLEQYVSSGASLPLEQHKDKMDTAFESSIARLDSRVRDVTLGFLKELTSAMVKSASRDLPGESEVKAWQLKGAMGYFLTYARRVTDYFSEQLHRFLLVSFARGSILDTLQGFHEDMLQKGMSPTDLLLFDKYYAEFLSVLNAALDRRACEGTTERAPAGLVASIVQEIAKEFAQIDLWNMIQFNDMVQVVRSEIEKKHKVEDQNGVPMLDRIGEALMDRLSGIETLIAETLPDIGETLLSRRFISQLIDQGTTGYSDLMTESIKLVDLQAGKSEQWKTEAKRLVSDAFQRTSQGEGFAPRLLAFTETLHESSESALTIQSVQQRVNAEAEKLQAEYNRRIGEWEEECSQVEIENAKIQQQNATRERLLKQAAVDYAREMAQYEEAKKAYGQSTVSSPPPKPPETLEQRILKTERMYPTQMTKPMPARPEEPVELLVDTELCDTIAGDIEAARTGAESLKGVFTDCLKAMRSQPAEKMTEQALSIPDGFEKYLMESTIRSIGRLLPRASRVYLKSPDEPDLIYLVSYEYEEDEMTVRIGSNFLR